MQGPRGPQPGATNRPRPSPRQSAGARAPEARWTFPRSAVRPPGRPQGRSREPFKDGKRRARARPRAPRGPAAAAAGAHPVPCRTRKLSPPAPEVLRGGPRGRKGRRRPARGTGRRGPGARPRKALLAHELANARRGPAAAAAGAHPVPCRTRKLSPPAPEVLRGGPRGRKGRRRPAPRVWGLPSGGPFFVCAGAKMALIQCV